MPELPERPDLDQLRRQARELLRAAARGEPSAVARLRAVSERVTLSAAQLAVAREYGYRSWPALKAEAERRRRLPKAAVSVPLPGADEQGSQDAPGQRWPFPKTAAVKTSVGILSPETLVVGAGHAVLHASLMPSEVRQFAAARPRRWPAPGMLLARWTRRKQSQRTRRVRADAAVATLHALTQADDITVADDQGVRYALRGGGMSSTLDLSGEPVGRVSMELGLDPVPGQQVTWIEIRGRESSCRARSVPDETSGDG
jgi:hypothetical protein